MPDSTLSQAIKEAYASAPASSIIYHTLEIDHPSFTDPIRVVRDTVNLTAILEATAPKDASTAVEFIGYQFDFARPEISPNGTPQCTVEIDNVSREILAQIEAAVLGGSQDLITICYREFMVGHATLIPTGTCVVEPSNKISKPTGTEAWDSDAYSLEKAEPGYAYAMAVPGQNNLHCGVGLNTDPLTSASFDSIDHFLNFADTGIIRIYENGVLVLTPGVSYVAGDAFEMIYSGTTISFRKNGVEFATRPAAANAEFHFEPAIYSVGASISDIRFHGIPAGPENDPPLTLTVSDINANVFRISATAGYSNTANKRFPAQDYTSEVFPGLIAA